MIQSYANGKKISFQTVDMDLSLAELEYEYLKFVCEQTLRNSDDILREQIRNLQLVGVPSFEQWRQQATLVNLAPAKSGENGLVKPEAKMEAVDVEAVEVEAIEIEEAPQPELPPEVVAPKRRGRKPGTKMPKRVPESDTGTHGVASTSLPEPQPKRRGRKPANLAALEPVVDTQPKRRGRKPANFQSEPTVGEALPEIPPKRRGRRPANLAAAEPVVDTPPKRRGRKPAAQSSIVTPETTVDTVPKRRGRKPRSAQTLPVESEANAAGLSLSASSSDASETPIAAPGEASKSLASLSSAGEAAIEQDSPEVRTTADTLIQDAADQPEPVIAKRRPRQVASAPATRKPRGRGRKAMR